MFQLLFFFFNKLDFSLAEMENNKLVMKLKCMCYANSLPQGWRGYWFNIPSEAKNDDVNSQVYVIAIICS